MQEDHLLRHPNNFIRKSALLATAELLRALPPPALAGAMMSAGSSDSDALLTERLQALQEQLRVEYESAEDTSIRCAGCASLALPFFASL
jgi:hypothetical protein